MLEKLARDQDFSLLQTLTANGFITFGIGQSVATNESNNNGSFDM
jgi:hypothetical protein